MADWAEVANFSDLAALLQGIANDLCGGTVAVQKTVNGATPEGEWNSSLPAPKTPARARPTLRVGQLRLRLRLE